MTAAMWDDWCHASHDTSAWLTVPSITYVYLACSTRYTLHEEKLAADTWGRTWDIPISHKARTRYKTQSRVKFSVFETLPYAMAVGCFLCRSISTFRFVCFDLKNEWPCLCSPNMKNPTGFFSIWESDDPSRRILGQNPTTRIIIFSNRKTACSLNSRCYPRQQTAAERSMSWMVTAV